MSDFEERKQRYTSDVDTLAGLYRDPLQNPIAVFVVTIVVGTVGYQAYLATVTHSFVLGIAVLGSGYGAYRLARVYWLYQNESIATELARRDVIESSTEHDPEHQHEE